MSDQPDNTNRFFRGQMEDEDVIAWSRKHWVSMLPDMIPFVLFLSLVTLTMLVINKIRLPSLTDPFFGMLIVTGIAAAVWIIHRFFLRMINYFTHTVIITNYRIVEIKKTLFLRDTKESFDLRKIQEVAFRQDGLLKNLLKFGELDITLGNSEIKTLSQLPNPDFHFRLLNKLKNDTFVRQQRSLNTTDATVQSSDIPSFHADQNLSRP